MSEIEESIDRVEKLYRTVTGKETPAATEQAYAPIPAERDPVQHVQEQMDRLFQMLGATPGAQAPEFAPPIAIWESEKEVTVFVDVPGTSRDRIELGVQANVLTVSGNRPAPIGNGHRLRFGERPIGAFRRIIPLPLGLKVGELSARLRDGVLEVVIQRDPSVGTTNPRLVTIS
jgi:HSP20 family protein